MHVRDSDVIVLRPGIRGTDHAIRRLDVQGSVDRALLPLDGEIELHRIVVPAHLPDTILDALPGRIVREIVEVPRELRGACPVRGCDHAGDTLFRIADRRIIGARRVASGTLMTVETLPSDETGIYR